MKIVFAGTPEFAASALRRLIDAGHDVVLVLTQPDRPAGRGMRMTPSAVKQVALAHGIEVLQPVSLKREREAVERLKATPHEVMVVAAYGLILPQEVLDIPTRGCLNIHASLLPRWRGAAPIQRAIEAGDRESGVCIMQMEAGLDTGPVLLSRAIALDSHETAATLHDRLAALGADMIAEVLAAPDAFHPVAQPATGVTYAAKISREEASLDFRQPARVLDCRIRAFDPFPGASATIGATTIKIWGCHGVDRAAGASPGTVLAAGPGGIEVACGDRTVIELTELQRPGAKRLHAREFLAGFPLPPGSRFDVPDGD